MGTKRVGCKMESVQRSMFLGCILNYEFRVYCAAFRQMFLQCFVESVTYLQVITFHYLVLKRPHL